MENSRLGSGPDHPEDAANGDSPPLVPDHGTDTSDNTGQVPEVSQAQHAGQLEDLSSDTETGSNFHVVDLDEKYQSSPEANLFTEDDLSTQVKSSGSMSKYQLAWNHLWPLRCQKSPPDRLPLVNLGLVSYMTYGWMTSWMWQLYKKGLDSVRHLVISDPERADLNCRRMEHLWSQELEEKGSDKASYGRVIFKAIKSRLLIGLLINVIASFLMIANPILIIRPFLEFLTDKKDEINGDLCQGFLYAILLAATIFLRGIVSGFSWMVHFEAAVRVRSGSLALMYRKILKLKSMRDKSVGDLVNLQSLDGHRFWDSVILCPQVMVAVVVMLICSIYGLVLMGPWALLAWLFIFGFYPVAFRLAKMSMDYRFQSMNFTDERVGFFSEVLSAIEVVKMYVLEKAFGKRISETRRKEQSILGKSILIQSFNMGFAMMVPLLSSCLTFVGYVATGNDLTVAKAFTFLSLLNTMQFSQAVVPFGLKAISDCIVSCQRYKEILLMEEMEPVSSLVNSKSSAVEIQNGTFSWPNKNRQDAEPSSGKDKKKKRKKSEEQQELKGIEENSQVFTGPVLRNIDVILKRGSFIGVCGQVASGKSSLLNAILGRLDLTSGTVAVSGTVAYVPQQPFILNDTLRDNIVFGDVFDPERYKQVVETCALDQDFMSFPYGDMTEAGEQGAALSGGQKQRLALARAAYSKSDILLLDDPLSAVDVNVAAHIFRQAALNTWKGRTVVFLTHNLQLLNECGHILVMQDSTIIEQGSHEKLVREGEVYPQLLQSFSLAELNIKAEGKEKSLSGSEENIQKSESSLTQSTVQSHLSNPAIQKSNGSSIHKTSLAKNECKLTGEEKNAASSISVNVIHKYIMAMGGYVIMLLLFVTFSAPVVVVTTAGWYLAHWLHQGGGNTSTVIANVTVPSSRLADNPDVQEYMIVYVCFIPLLFLTILLRSLTLTKACLSAARSIHREALTNILHRPMPFFYSTPVGRIVNRFSGDLDEVDNQLPMNLEIFLNNILQVIAAVTMIAYTSLWFLLAAIPLAVVFLFLIIVFHSGVQQLKSLENTTLSPVLSHMGASVKGVATIHAYRKSHHFTVRHCKLVDASSVAKFLHATSNRWLAVRLDFLAAAVILLTGMLIVATFDHLNASLAGLAISYVVQMSGLFQYTARLFVEAEAKFTAVERLQEYTCNEKVESRHSLECPSDQWPQHGDVKFKKVNLRYRPGLPHALEDVNFHITAKERVGIVGRTGAGKTSLATVLFRLMEVESGSIFIDDVNIGQLDVECLRKRLSIIPQDATLFTGTLRYNLDPCQAHSDADLWEALHSCHVADLVKSLDHQLDTPVAEKGDNFSLGEKQLLCFARASLRKSKVFILDEATASMDNENKLKIQKVLDTTFADCTQLIIAHRLSTVLGCDHILVMDNGQVLEYDTPANLLSDPSSKFKAMVDVSEEEVLSSESLEKL